MRTDSLDFARSQGGREKRKFTDEILLDSVTVIASYHIERLFPILSIQ